MKTAAAMGVPAEVESLANANNVDDDLKRSVCNFCGSRAQSHASQDWFSAELENVIDEDEEIAAVEVWEAVACPDCEDQIKTTAALLKAQGWQPIAAPF